MVRPDLSADGKNFVMRVPRRTQDDVVVVSRDGANWRDLINDKYFDRYPRWSPNGRQIAFTSDRGGGYEIWMIDADGTNLRQITFVGRPGTSFPLWSPNGSQLLFRADPSNYTLDLSKSWREQTPQPLPLPVNPLDYFVAWDWSPDGTKLSGAFNTMDASGRSGGASRIGFFSFESKRYEELGTYEGQPMWLPDSRRLVFSSEGRIYIADTVTKSVKLLITEPMPHIRSVAVSRDGSLLYYTSSSSESDVWLLDLD